MSNNSLGRTEQAILTNKSGGSLAQGDVVIVDSANAAAVTTTTTSGFINGRIGVVLEPNGIANNDLGMIAFSGYVPKINLSSSASLGDLVKTHTVAKQGVRHAAPAAAGDFAQVLGTGTSPAALLFGSVLQAAFDGSAITGTGTFALSGDISPSQITADQNDYNPTSLSTASVLRLSSDASRNITGLQGGSDGRVIAMVNIGSNNIVLKNESASSTAANRFALQADITLAGGDGVILWYDSTSSRWRAIGKTPGGSGGGGSGALVLLEQQSASGSAQLDLAAWYSTTYDEYMIEIVGLVPATNAVDPLLRFSTDGGSSYDSGSNYSASGFRWSQGGTAVANAGGTSIKLDASGTQVNTSTKSFNATIRLFNPGSTALHKRLICAAYSDDGSGNPDIGIEVRGSYNSTSAVNAFRVLMSSGNITSGTIRVYGIAKS